MDRARHRADVYEAWGVGRPYEKFEFRGTIIDPSYTLENGQLAFTRTLKGLRNTVLLPAGWTVTSVTQSATIGAYEGRTFLAFINLNAENEYVVRIRATRPPTL